MGWLQCFRTTSRINRRHKGERSRMKEERESLRGGEREKERKVGVNLNMKSCIH